jgi:nucleoside-diphosphate-sugar epimerase
MSKKIAVLGANGFLGSPIVETFCARGWEVVGFSRSKNINSAVQEYSADLFNEASLKLALSKSKPNVVLSTAWDTQHGKFWTNESNVVYRDATLRFAELSFEAGAEAFIGLGTMSEYGSSPGFCNAYSSPLVANDIYSRSKIETGLRLQEIGNRLGGRTNWIRAFQAFGPSEKPERFIPGLLSNLANKRKFSIRTPNFEMDWIHTSDVAAAIFFAIENQLEHFVDVGTGIGTTVRDLSELLCEELGLDSSLLDYSEQIPGHQKKAVVAKESVLLSRGWQPAESLRNRIRSLR